MSGLADQTRWMDATDQAALVARGEVTPSELLEAAIERIEQSNPVVNAVVIEWFDHARSVAADPDLPDGPFRGVPFLLKDLYASFAGQTLSNGNRALKEAGKIDAADTTLVARFKAAGLAATAADEAQRLLTNASRALRRARVQADALRKRGIHDATAGRRRGRLARGVHDLQNLLAATRQIVAQTRQRIAGHTPDVRTPHTSTPSTRLASATPKCPAPGPPTRRNRGRAQ